MKIFPNTKSAPTKSTASAKEGKVPRGPGKAAKKLLPEKKDISASEIKERLAANVSTSDVSKNMAIKNTKKLGEGFLNDEIKPQMIEVAAPKIETVGKEIETEVQTPNTKDFVLNSDIAKNDPKDTNTQEKLKSVISRGGFNFNPKEREALEKILAG